MSDANSKLYELYKGRWFRYYLTLIRNYSIGTNFTDYLTDSSKGSGSYRGELSCHGGRIRSDYGVAV